MSLIQTLKSAPAFFANSLWGGPYVLSGTLSVNGNPSRRPVRLYESGSGYLIAEQWSGSDGRYAFTGLTHKYRYQLVATDYPDYHYADRDALQTPGNWALDINLDNAAGSLVVNIGSSDYAGLSGFNDANLLRANALFANANYGGGGVIVGTVTLSAVPVQRRVRLIDQKTGFLIAAMKTDSAGRFAFSGLATRLRYAVMASDFPDYAYADAVASNLAATGDSINYYDPNRPTLPPLYRSERNKSQPNYGGTGMVAGTVKVGVVSVKKRIRLYEHGTGILVRESWSGADGSYSFNGLNKGYRYTVTATDYPDYTYNDTIACNITPV